jgi:hypothetical protein
MFIVLEIIHPKVAVLVGPDKIKARLARQNTFIGQRTVYRIICKYELNRPLSRPRKMLRYIR